ncbi:helix-turn-helix domain-containing protein [Streptomyces longwoodensis]|nr:helix-turn-helix domain-containing protein [Streptomyces longwoodensis]WRY87033.1 helix-turn-helix domain-containing protein [Streptomyces longwoodensis]
MTTPHSAPPERSVVDRTLSILGAFDRDNRTLSLSDISRRSGLPVATVHRIVNKLHGWGALEIRGGRLQHRAAPVGDGGPRAARLHAGRDGPAPLHRPATADRGRRDRRRPGRPRGRVPHLRLQRPRPRPLRRSGAPGAAARHRPGPDPAGPRRFTGAADEVGPLRAYTPKTVTDGPTHPVPRQGAAEAARWCTACLPRAAAAVPVRDAPGRGGRGGRRHRPRPLVQPAKVAGPVHAAATMISPCHADGGRPTGRAGRVTAATGPRRGAPGQKRGVVS